MVTEPGVNTKIVLVGGQFTLEDGTVMDSRQKIEGDSISQVMQRTLAGSWLWWDTVCSLVTPILRARGPEAFALIIGQRSVVDIRGDGSIKRTTLRGLLPAASTTVKIVRINDEDAVFPEGFEKVSTLRGKSGHFLGTLGIQLLGPVNAGWRFLDGNDYYFADVGRFIAPSVIVDTTANVTSPYICAAWAALEKRRLFDHVVLIFPHTYRSEAVVRNYPLWLKPERTDTLRYNHIEGESRQSAESNAIFGSESKVNAVTYAQSIPIEADFRVTGLIEDDEWRSPDDLEAARSLLSTRYDLKIGIWDLVRNPLLRRTLLELTPADPVPPPGGRLPASSLRRAGGRIVENRVQRDNEAAALAALKLQAEPLFSLGWALAPGPQLLWRPLAEVVMGHAIEWTLVHLSLSIFKREASVLLHVRHDETSLLQYVRARREPLEAIAQTQLPKLDKIWPVLWRGKGGWGDEVDWMSRFGGLAEMTRQWVPLFDDLVTESRQREREKYRRYAR